MDTLKHKSLRQPMLFRVQSRYFVKADNIAIRAADCSCFTEAVEFCFQCYYVFDVEYPADLRVFYMFVEAVLDVQCVKSTTVLDLLRSLSKRSGRDAEGSGSGSATE